MYKSYVVNFRRLPCDVDHNVSIAHCQPFCLEKKRDMQYAADMLLFIFEVN